MGNKVPACEHLALLGDSTIDNGAWTGGGDSVHQQVVALLPQTTLCAQDGALLSAIPQQAAKAPKKTSHFLVSVGGNDCLSGVNVTSRSVQSVEEGLDAIQAFTASFEEEYARTVEELIEVVGHDKHIILCSVYNPCFGPFGVTTLTQTAANVSVALIADAILRVATRLRLPVIDWRRVMTQVIDFANPIEPSSVGGQKMAQVLVDVVSKHDFSSKTCIIYPEQYPISELSTQPHDDLSPQGLSSKESSMSTVDSNTPSIQPNSGKSDTEATPTNILENEEAAGVVREIRASNNKTK